ncbi:MAG: hypothetical protein SF162_00005 [bacterium]|nr:hypothetical protein [bacterium]
MNTSTYLPEKRQIVQAISDYWRMHGSANSPMSLLNVPTVSGVTTLKPCARLMSFMSSVFPFALPINLISIRKTRTTV